MEEPSIDLRFPFELGACVFVTQYQPGNGIQELLGSISDIRSDDRCLALIVSHFDVGPTTAVQRPLP